jgi:Cu/Ag efflux protein CusF
MPYRLAASVRKRNGLAPGTSERVLEEKSMRKFLSVGLVIAALMTSPLSAAQAHEGQDHPVVAGKVTKVDASAGKITIAHEAIPNLQMEAMTMVFKVSDPAMLNEVKPGDAIKFTADRINGELTVDELEKAR